MKEPQRKRLPREKRSRGVAAAAGDTAQNRVRGRKTLLLPSSFPKLPPNT